MRDNSFAHALAEHLREALGFLRVRVSAPPESVSWQGFVGRFSRELMNLPSFEAVMKAVSEDRSLTIGLLKLVRGFQWISWIDSSYPVNSSSLYLKAFD